ncbi:hypothetical protein X770_00875 [Mesorhizobium sp. LSJC269B00]|uniref:hypothetical protein n=1 Tax=Mesorhizobium sp. LSJC269B00 TaxID=1287326 RepID=UPI0003CF54E6|nr:hypothetical protein [Mesorhizobium sp. LSJC269B00]ESW93813.1 hypothetical protein X770_00875 [Mesorhizobium sp. LSJC269B00]
MKSMLLQSSPDKALLISTVAKDHVVRIDIKRICLKPGEFAELAVELIPPSRQYDYVQIIGDDPATRDGTNVSLTVQASAGDTITITDKSVSIRPEIWSRAEFILVYDNNRWINYLPAVFRQDSDQASFLGRFLSSAFQDGERIEANIDRIGDLIAPSRLPSMEAARFLAGWFDIDIDLVLGRQGQSSDDKRRSIALARRFLTHVIPYALEAGTSKSVLNWIDAVAEARGMSPDRRRRIAVVEGYKMRRLFTLPANHSSEDPEPTPLRTDWGWLANSAPLGSDPLATRVRLDSSELDGKPTLGVSGESDDDMLGMRTLASRLWMFVPPHIDDDPTPDDWKRLLAPILPAHIGLEVVDRQTPFNVGYNTVLGMTTTLPPLPLGSVRLGQDSLLAAQG